MKIKFIDPRGNLPSSLINLGYSPRAQLYNLKNGEILNVYGISVWRNTQHYLIFSIDEIFPTWLPADLFEVVDPRMHYEWYFAYFGDNSSNGLKLLIGYKELVLEESYYADLIEADKRAIQIFLQRKKEIDEEL